MMTIAELTTFLGWASVINMFFLIITSVSMIFLRDKIAPIHSKMMGIPQNELPKIYFKYLAMYKILTLIFFIAPYLSLKIMGA